MTGTRQPLPVVAATVVMAIAVAPWALGFSSSHAAVAAHIAFAMTFAPIALLIAVLPPAAVATAAAGAWLAVSPWALGYASLGGAAWLADALAGLLLIALARSGWPPSARRESRRDGSDAVHTFARALGVARRRRRYRLAAALTTALVLLAAFATFALTNGTR